MDALHGRTLPIVGWNERGHDHDGVAWWAQLDDRYLVEVRPETDQVGMLCVFDHHRDDTLVLQRRVRFHIGASFGPSVEDLEEWQHVVETWVDGPQ